MSSADETTRTAIDTVGKLAANIYADAASPAVRRAGGALDTMFKIGLSPVSLLDWGFERSKEWLTKKITERLATIPEQFQQPPPSQIAVPVLLAIASASDSEALRALYAELLIKAMDSRTESTVHPSYVSVLGQLTPQEALIFLSFRGQEARSLFIDLPRTADHRKQPTIEDEFHAHCVSIGFESAPSQIWLQNLLRLRLLELTTYTDAIYRAPEYEHPEPSVDTRDERHLTITEYGSGFMEACAPPQTPGAA